MLLYLCINTIIKKYQTIILAQIVVCTVNFNVFFLFSIAVEKSHYMRILQEKSFTRGEKVHVLISYNLTINKEFCYD
jgi:hypothetical protein